MSEATPGERPTVTFEITPEDWVEVSLRHYGANRDVRKSERTAVTLFIVIVILLALLALLNGSSSLAIIWLLVGGVGAALMPRAIRGARKKQFVKYARNGIANGFFGTHRVELREDGILNVTDGYEWLIRWSGIERVEDSEAAFLVYNGTSSFMVIPHSAFRDSASLRRFADVFYERLGAAREAGGREPLPGASPPSVGGADPGPPGDA